VIDRVGAQLEGQRLVAVRPGPRLRQLRHDLELGRDLDQLVAQGSENDATDEGACTGRVEHIGIVLQTYPQRGRLSNRSSAARERCQGQGEGQSTHGKSSPESR